MRRCRAGHWASYGRRPSGTDWSGRGAAVNCGDDPDLMAVSKRHAPFVGELPDEPDLAAFRLRVPRDEIGGVHRKRLVGAIEDVKRAREEQIGLRLGLEADLVVFDSLRRQPRKIGRDQPELVARRRKEGARIGPVEGKLRGGLQHDADARRPFIVDRADIAADARRAFVRVASRRDVRIGVIIADELQIEPIVAHASEDIDILGDRDLILDVARGSEQVGVAALGDIPVVDGVVDRRRQIEGVDLGDGANGGMFLGSKLLR